VRTGFTRPEIADYRSNGFLSVPDVLTVDELAHWREVVDAAMATATKRGQDATARRCSLSGCICAGTPRGWAAGRGSASRSSGRRARGRGRGPGQLDQALVKETYGAPRSTTSTFPGGASPHATRAPSGWLLRPWQPPPRLAIAGRPGSGARGSVHRPSRGGNPADAEPPSRWRLLVPQRPRHPPAPART
jgi:hypothetical protein